MNPNFGYTAILPGAQAGRNPLDPQAISVTLANPGIFNNPQTISPTSNFAAVTPESNTLRDYDNANYIFTYHFPTFDLRYIGGYQQYNYTLNYGNADQAGNGTDVTSFTLPGTGPTNRLVINPTDFLHYQRERRLRQPGSLAAVDRFQPAAMDRRRLLLSAEVQQSDRHHGGPGESVRAGPGAPVRRRRRRRRPGI